MLAVACRPLLPSFTPVEEEMGLNLLADATGSGKTQGFTKANTSLHQPGPYNPAAALPPKLVKRILALEFVDMSELRADVWPEEFGTGEGTSAGFRRPPSKPPIIDIRIWTECYGRMVAILASRFPEKAPELWSYQATILRATHNYEGGNWVAYDRQYRRELLAKGDLNWSSPNARLYSRFGVIPKGHNTGRWRLITDLSYPPGESVNDGKEAELCSLVYTSIDQVARVAAGYEQGALLAKVDIEAAYRRLIPVHPRTACCKPHHGKESYTSTQCCHLACTQLPSCSMQWLMHLSGIWSSKGFATSTITLTILLWRGPRTPLIALKH